MYSVRLINARAEAYHSMDNTSEGCQNLIYLSKDVPEDAF